MRRLTRRWVPLRLQQAQIPRSAVRTAPALPLYPPRQPEIFLRRSLRSMARVPPGLSVQQTYTVTMVTSTPNADPTMPGTTTRTDLTGGQKLIAVPTNVGPRTMPCYSTNAQGVFPPNGGFDCTGVTALAKQGIYSLANGVRVFAGTVDDPFYIDLGAAFDSLNFRASAFFGGGTTAAGIPLPILLPTQDINDQSNSAPDAVSGFNVNTIAIEVPMSLVRGTRAVIGTWGATYRPK